MHVRGNPTRSSLEEQMASLEDAGFAYAFASGLAAEDAVLRALLSAGDHMILPLDAYGGTFRLVESVHKGAGIEYATADIDARDALDAAWRDETRLVWVETPSNPSLSIVDIAATADYVHSRGANLVVDNTFATPYLQNPLALGADVVVHSTTKYLGGHSDAVGGLVALNDADVAGRIGFLQNATGAVPGPWDSYLIQRGVKTLAIRMDRHCANAHAVADFLHAHDLVATDVLPRTGDASRPRRGREADAGVRGDRLLPPCRGRGRRPGHGGTHRGLHPGRVVGGGGVAHRTSGPDDTRRPGPVAAGRGSGPRSLVGRHREHRRSAGGSRSSFAGLMWASSPQLGRLTSTRSVPPGSGHCLSRRAQVGDRSWSGEPRRLLSRRGATGDSARLLAGVSPLHSSGERGASPHRHCIRAGRHKQVNLWNYL